MTSKWRHVVNTYSKFEINFSSKPDSFQKNEGQIRNQWCQMYSSEHIHDEYNNFFQGGMVPLILTSSWRVVTQKVFFCTLHFHERDLKFVF